MINNSDLKCPTCGSFDLKQTYCLHVGKKDNWTTRHYRELNDLKPDRGQSLVVPPMDDTWFRCNMCNSEFDGNGVMYKTNKWPGLYREDGSQK